MKRILTLTGAFVLSCAVLVGCARGSRHGEVAEAEPRNYRLRLTGADLETVADQSAKSLLASAAFGPFLEPPGIGMGRILNQTGQQLDLDAFGLMVMTRVLSSGKARIVDEEQPVSRAGSPSDSPVEGAPKRAPDFRLQGRVSEMLEMDGTGRHAVYRFHLLLVDQRGTVVWMNEAKLVK